ncbi:hypothetical protein YC2023_086231 [Brassica napus]
MPDNDGVAMQTLYDNPAPCSGYQQARKKKAEDGLMEEGNFTDLGCRLRKHLRK